MVKVFLFTALAVASVSAHADEWKGSDKVQHLWAGVAVSGIATEVTKNEFHGFLAGVAAGVGKELYDASGYGHASMKDIAWTVAGAYIGAKLGGVFISPTQKGASTRTDSSVLKFKKTRLRLRFSFLWYTAKKGLI